jgi:hypothetical protein
MLKFSWVDPPRQMTCEWERRFARQTTHTRQWRNISPRVVLLMVRPRPGATQKSVVHNGATLEGRPPVFKAISAKSGSQAARKRVNYTADG